MRRVEVLQWREEPVISLEKYDIHNYKKVWSEDLIDSTKYFDQSKFNESEDFVKTTEVAKTIHI
jgi:hypothetical protein